MFVKICLHQPDTFKQTAFWYMKIAIYDLIHLEQVLPLLRISVYLRIPTICFTSARFRKDIEIEIDDSTGLLEFIYKGETESEPSFMRMSVKTSSQKNCSILILNSIHGKFYLWFLLLRKVSFKTVLTIHEVNGMFYPRPSINIRKFVRYWGKKKLVSIVSGFIVNTEPMLNYMEQRRLVLKPVTWVPAVVYGDREMGPQKKPFIVIVPGLIDQRRRNYVFVLDVYEKLCIQQGIGFRLILAGMPYGEYGRRIQDRCNQLNNLGGDIIFYADEVPAHDFDQLMTSAHLIWSPLLPETSILDGINEVYGETKNSGNTHDAVMYARPMLIPEQLKTAKELSSSVLRYSDSETCAEQIRQLISDPEMLTQLLLNAVTNSGKFSIDLVSAQYKLMIRSVAPGFISTH